MKLSKILSESLNYSMWRNKSDIEINKIAYSPGVTAGEIANTINASRGGTLRNDYEAWAQIAFNAIKDQSMYAEVEKLLGKDPYTFISDYMKTDDDYRNDGNTIDKKLKKLQFLTQPSYYKKEPISIKKLKSRNEIPFKNREQGNRFRIFVNNEYPEIARKLDLDKTGNYNNNYVLKALNTVIDGQTMLTLYNNWTATPANLNSLTKMYQDIYKSMPTKKGANTDTAGEEIDQKMKDMIERYNIPKDLGVKNSKRIADELYYIQLRKANQEYGFFIVDPRLNLVFAFDKNYKLIDYSQSVASKDKQQEKIFTRDDWMKLSGFEVDPEKSIFKGSGRYYKIIDGKKYIYRDKNQATDVNGNNIELPKKRKFKVRYDVLKAAKAQYQAAGIYTIGSLYYVKGYTQQTGADGKNIEIPNAYGLETLDGTDLGTAIHSLAKSGRRIKADAELQQYLQKEKEAGRIPDEYINAVEWAMGSDKYDKSAGCFNVSPSFVQNPKVQAAMTVKKSRVFIMSEQPENYLVRVDQGKEADYFDKLSNGDDGRCVNPNSLTDTYGQDVV